MGARQLILILRLVLGFLLLATGVGKLLDIPGFLAVINTYRLLPEPMAVPAAVILVYFELRIAEALLLARGVARAALASAALHGFFMVWSAIALVRGLEIPNCGCFGVFYARPLTVQTLVEDLVVLLLSVLLYRLIVKGQVGTG